MNRNLVLLLAVVLTAGCIVQSIQPFLTEDSKVAVPELTGEWTLATSFGEDVAGKNIKPWTFAEDKVVTYDDNGLMAPVLVQYFRVGEVLLCQSAPGDTADAEVNWFWAWHVVPIVTLCKVELKADTVRFLPLNLEWLKAQIAAGKLTLPHISRDEKGEMPLFTATTAQWTAFLKKYASQPEAFDEKHVYVLKKKPTPSPSAPSTPPPAAPPQ